MKHGPLVFLAAFLALTASWSGFVLAPQLQIGRQQQETNTVNTAELYPQARPGLARQGLEIYRANGCAACHSQQVGQNGTVCDVVLTEAGTNPVVLAEALVKANIGISKASAPGLAAGVPKRILRGVTIEAAKTASTIVKSTGAKAKIEILPRGPDIARGWGPRRNVAADYLFDDPVMLGSARVGPDLANVALRLPDPNWHLRHLYAPRLDVKDSPMPPYRFLFEKHRILRQPSPDALELAGNFAPPTGYEIVPRPEANALVAYLLSLRSDTPLFEAPLTPAVAPAAAAPTNAPAK
jgi:cbb3-type cytochrome oxidase cytochrome c subunit